MPPEKPLGQKAYGSIAHLPGSRLGPGDHHAHIGQARIATEKARDRHDRIIVQEKLDGSCVAVAKLDGKIVPLIRSGYRATDSPWPQHHLFAAFVREWEAGFDDLLREGERAVGEWLAQAHGTRYDLGYHLAGRSPLVLFDLMVGHERRTVDTFYGRVHDAGPLFVGLPKILSDGPPFGIEEAMAALDTYGFYGAQDPVEGVVWRVERRGVVDFLAKFVKSDKVDGLYFPEHQEDGQPIWNWNPHDR